MLQEASFWGAAETCWQPAHKGIFNTGWEAICAGGTCWESYCGVDTELPGKLAVGLVEFSEKIACWTCIQLLRKAAKVLTEFWSVRETHWEINFIGCPAHWPALEQQEKGSSTLQSERKAPSSAVSLQDPLLTKCNIMPAGQRETFIGSDSGSQSRAKRMDLLPRGKTLKTSIKDVNSFLLWNSGLVAINYVN